MYIVILYTYTCMYTKLLHTTLQRLFFQFQRALLKTFLMNCLATVAFFLVTVATRFSFLNVTVISLRLTQPAL